MKRMLYKECYKDSFPSDIWTSRTSEAYILVKVHFLTEVFEHKSFNEGDVYERML